jgi:hypothetical protein
MPPQTPSLFGDIEPLASARDELNFAEFPIALLSDRPAEGVSELVFQDSIRNQSNGKLVERKVKVLGVEPYGLPNSKDEEILLGLISLTKLKSGFGSRELRFTRYELAKHLGWSTDGRSYRRIDEAIERWTSTTLRYDNSWWDAETKQWCDVLFHVIETAVIGKPQARGKGGIVMIQWNTVAFKSFESGYLKNINLPFYQSLDSAASKRLYRFLDKHFYQRHRLEYDLAELAFEKVGLSRDYEAWKVKQKLQPAISELEDRGYLERLSPAERFLKAGRGKWRIVFTKNKAEETKAIERTDDKTPELAALLVAQGLTAVAAKKALAKPPKLMLAATLDEHVKLCVEGFKWALEQKDKPKSPRGFLYSLVTEGYLPDGFIPLAEKQKQAEERTRAAVEQSRKNRDEAATHRAELAEQEERKKRVDAFLAGLSPADRKKLEERAIQTGPTKEVEQYRQAMAAKLTSWAEKCLCKLLEHAISSTAAKSS